MITEESSKTLEYLELVPAIAFNAFQEIASKID